MWLALSQAIQGGGMRLTLETLKTPHEVLVSADLPRCRSGSAPLVFLEQLTFGL